MKKDGHIHTPFCPHGTKDAFEEYIEKAIQLGFSEISFTEHAPLPEGFIDTTPDQDSGMKLEELEAYFEQINQLKPMYKDKIRINCGLEVDYVEGFEAQTKDFLNYYGHKLDDAVLSVHFLKHGDTYDCLDYSPNVFEKMIRQYGSIQHVYENYFRTLLKSIQSDLGPFKPKRIGHITLVRKFQKKFPMAHDYRSEILQILQAMKERGYELDYNGAGTSKPLCGETYPPKWVSEEAIKLQIPLVYGSDAHQVKELKQGYNALFV
ncbi:histidinol-phosphatase HisJ [Robertmurraya kyonggiensis]|uniref:Histidinol-phosphatase n=1 Tax=Robertmurraya kyonggiensis TaxID=1037680 RepID=A0A4U1D168_9BACI|nr:histidinol-phosphatase HisJ [Robertmurraya kyonggiensis]TKC15814.1 histidinol-phosphatase HisJ [Robertmurraya kyonggiensis]